MKKSIICLVAIIMAASTVFVGISCKTATTTTVAETTVTATTVSEGATSSTESSTEIKSTATGDQWFVEKTAPFKGKSLRVVTSSGYGFTEALKLNAKDFTDLTGIKVEVSELSWSELHEKILANHVAKTYTYDVVNIDGWPAPSLWNAGAIVNLQPYFDKGDLISPDFDLKDFVPNDIKYNSTWPIGKDLYCIPYECDVLMLFYNTKYFAEYGLKPPQTWAEFENIATVLNGKDLNADGKEDYGFGIFAKKGGDLPASWHARFVSYGGVFLDDKNMPHLNDDAAVKGMELLRKHLQMAAPGSYDWDTPMLSRAFINGDIAMCENWALLSNFANDPKESKIIGQWDATVIPAVAAGRGPIYGGWASGIPVEAENPDLSFLFIQWASSKNEMKKVVMELGLPQSRVSVLQDPEVLKKFPYYKALLQGLNAGEAFVKIPETMEIYEVLMEYVSEAAQPSNNDPKATLDAMQEAVYNVLLERGYY